MLLMSRVFAVVVDAWAMQLKNRFCVVAGKSEDMDCDVPSKITFGLPEAAQFISMVWKAVSFAIGPVTLSTVTDVAPSLWKILQLVEPVPVSFHPTIRP